MTHSSMFISPRTRSSTFGFLETIGTMLIAFAGSFWAMAILSMYVGRNIIEPFFILGGALVLRANPMFFHSVRCIVSTSKFAFFAGLLLLFSLLGLLTGEAESILSVATSVFADLRSIFLFFFLWFVAESPFFRVDDIDRIFTKIFFFLALFEVFSVWRYGGGGVYLDADEYSRMTVLALAPMFLVLRMLVSGRIIFAYGALLMTLYVAVVSLMRLNYAFVGVGIVALVVFSLKYLRGVVSSLKSILLITGLIVGVIVLPVKIINYLEENPIRLIHGLNRFTELFEDSGVDNDTTRKGNVLILLKEPEEFIIPRGIGTRAQTTQIMREFRAEYGVMSSVDSNVFYCIYHFGLFVGVGFLIFIFGKIFRSCWQALRRSAFSSATIMCVAFSVTFLLMFSLKAWVFTYFSSALAYGLLLPWIFRAKDFNEFYRAKYGR